MPRYPDIEIKIRSIHSSGNAFVILGETASKIRAAHGNKAAELYKTEARSGDYQNLLGVTASWVTFKDLDGQYNEQGERISSPEDTQELDIADDDDDLPDLDLPDDDDDDFSSWADDLWDDDPE